MRDHEPLPIEEFRGYWNRGDLDNIPPEYQSEFINFKTLESGFETRSGIDGVGAGTVNTVRIYPYFDASVGDGYLELRTDTKIYHVFGTVGAWTTFQVSNAIAGMTDFAFVSINQRAYISPSTITNLGGINGEFIYVYDGGGVNMMRKAAGTGPTVAEGAMAAANSATAGNVEAGVHIFGVVYQTNSGFLTQIGPDHAFPTVTASGNKKVDLSAIPVFGGGGGTLITKRLIVASKLIPVASYTGDPTAYQLFFVPGGTINDNTTLILTVNFFDSELISDASHLFNLLSSLPAVSGLGTYHNRMIAWDINGAFGTSPDGIGICMVSNAGEPEAMNAVNGFVQVPREGTGITYCQEYRDILYVMKFNKIIAFNDNGNAPTSWPDAVVDNGLGCGKYGVATVGIYGGINIESFIAINDQGIYNFTGNLTTPELSYVIKDFWSTITPRNINVGQISAYTDSLHQQLFVCIPELNMILVGDYSNGMNAEKIKWQKWTFSKSPKSIFLFDKDNKLFIAFDVGVHYIHIGTTADTFNGSAAAKIPDPTFISAYLPNSNDENLMHYGGTRLRVIGSGNLLPTMLGLDSVLTNTLATIPLNATPGREPFVLANLVAQKARLQLITSVINEHFRLNRLNIYTKAIYTSYPM